MHELNECMNGLNEWMNELNEIECNVWGEWENSTHFRDDILCGPFEEADVDHHAPVNLKTTCHDDTHDYGTLIQWQFYKE